MREHPAWATNQEPSCASLIAGTIFMLLLVAEIKKENELKKLQESS